VRGEHGGERRGIADTTRHRQRAGDHCPALAIGHAGERLVRERPLEGCPDRAVAGRQQRQRAAHQGDHLGVLLEEVGVFEPDRQERLGHAPAVAGGVGGGRDVAQDGVRAIVAGERQGASARELEVEPLVLGRARQSPVRANRALVLLGGDVPCQLRRRLVACPA
jgi:hypothetical protein